MSYNKNTAGQKFNVLAVNSATGLPVTGDAANITAKISLDSGAFAAVADTNPTELDATNAAGVYVFDLSQAETNGDVLTIVPSSTTANVEIDMLNIYTSTPVDTSSLATLANQTAMASDITDILVDTTSIDSASTAIKAKTDQLVFTVANQVDSNALTGGTSAADIYTYFTTGSNEDVFKADVSTLDFGGTIYDYVEQTWESVAEDPESNLWEPIADKVWDTLLVHHQNAGSTGKALTDLPSAADIMASGDIDGYTLEEALKLCAAVLAGKVSGAGTTEITFRAVDDSKDRVVATVAGEGNRTSVTIDVTG